MNRNVFVAAFVLGAVALVWVGVGYVGTNLLALTMTLLIAAVYCLGGHELRQFRRATSSLATALARIPEPLPTLDGWLANFHPSLQNPVRLRIEGERIALPGPALTPYLVGLLVMLGMLGTFLGMVVTLNGAVFALEGSTELSAMRSALSAPIRGLGLAFGTSVAGVAASAMLGLMSALARRERMLVVQVLDSKIASVLRGFSLTHQRQETFKALQYQAQALPDVVDKLQAMMAQMERSSQQLNERLIGNQESFHSEVKGVYGELARSVDQSLKDSLSQSARIAGESITPVVEAAMQGIAAESTRLQQRMIDAAQAQLDDLSHRFNASANQVARTWSAALADQEQTNAKLINTMGQSLQDFSSRFEQGSTALLGAVDTAYATLQSKQSAADQQRLQAWTQSLEAMAETLQQQWQQAGEQTLAQQQQICSTLTQSARDISDQARASAGTTLGEVARLVSCAEELIQTRIAAESEWMTQHSARMDQLAAALRSELSALREEEAQRGQAAVDRLGDLQTALAAHLTTLGTALEEPISRLIETASEAPRAAAEVIGQLRQEISSSMARDNTLLEERSRIMETLSALLDTINHAAAEQRAVIDSLVASSAVALNQAGSQFAQQVSSETGKLADIAAQVTGSAVEVSSLGEAFGLAVASFNEANEKLVGNLQRIEAAMDKSSARSDEQLAYYVAQAREIIDLSMMSQKEVFEELRQFSHQLSHQHAPQAPEVS